MTDRRTSSRLRKGLRALSPLSLVWFAGCLLLWTLVRQDGIPYAELVLDPSQYGNRPWYTGLISNLGVLGWTTATVASAIGGTAATRGQRHGAATMLRSGATLSGLLLLDDLFQFHIVVPNTLGQPKVMFYVLYAGLAGWWAIDSLAELARTRWVLLAAAIAALSVSVAVDVVGGGSDRTLILEDSAKFLGILAWALYFVMTTNDIVGSLAAAPMSRGVRPIGESPIPARSLEVPRRRL